ATCSQFHALDRRPAHLRFHIGTVAQPRLLEAATGDHRGDVDEIAIAVLAMHTVVGRCAHLGAGVQVRLDIAVAFTCRLPCDPRGRGPPFRAGEQADANAQLTRPLGAADTGPNGLFHCTTVELGTELATL